MVACLARLTALVQWQEAPAKVGWLVPSMQRGRMQQEGLLCVGPWSGRELHNCLVRAAKLYHSQSFLSQISTLCGQYS